MRGFMAIVLFISLMLPQCAMAQRINFRTLAGSADIDVQVVGLPELNFNDASPVIVVGSGPLLIGRNSFEQFIVPVRIEAPADYELTVTVSAPLFLQLEGFIPSEGQPTPTLPFQVGWGYWNRAAGNLVPGSGTGGLNGTETELLSGFVEVVNPSYPGAIHQRLVPGTPQHPRRCTCTASNPSAWGLCCATG
jgi:hypothetical protein